jgi:tetratricopeptide (TPR) repeat protein
MRTSTGHKAMSLALAAVMTLGTEGQVLAAMAPATGPSGQVAASGQSAGDLSAQAIDRFKAKDYDAAARLFDEAYKLDPNPNYLFNIGRVYEEKGDIRNAVDYYQRFVKEPGVELESRELALQRLRVLKAILQETDAAEAKPEPETKPEPEPETKPEPIRQPPPEDPRPRKLQLAGYGLLAVGGVATVVGGILGGVTLAKQNELAGIHDYNSRVDLAARGKSLALGTDVLIFTGGALLVTGVILVAVGAAKRKGKSVAARRVLPAGFGLVARF